MGADFIGWRDCPLQTSLGEDGFFHKQKLVAYRRGAEAIAPKVGDDLEVCVTISNRPVQNYTYGQIVAEIGDFEAGIPECADCPLSEGRPLGCYRYITFPIPAIIEESLAEFALRELARRDSPLAELLAIYGSDERRLECAVGFRQGRGKGAPRIAEREAPIALLDPALLDPAELLAMLKRVPETHKVTLHVPTWDSADLLAVILNPIQERRELELLVPVWEAWTSSDAGKRAAEHEWWFEWDSCRRLVVAVHEHLSTNPAAAVLIDA